MADTIYYTKLETDYLVQQAKKQFSNIYGNAKPLAPADPTPVAGWYKPTVSSASPGTNYPNAGNLKAITGFDTVFFYNGTTWTKVENALPGATPSFDKTDNANSATMKATYDASKQFFDKAFLDGVGDGSEVVLGRDTDFALTSTTTAVYVNNITPATVDGTINEIKINLPAANPKAFVVLEKTGANVYKTVNYFEVFGLVAGINTISVNVRLPKNCLLGVVYNGTQNGYTTGTVGWSYTGFSGFGMATIGATSSTGISNTGYLPYTYKVKYDKLTGDEAMNLLKEYRSRKDKTVYYPEDFGAVALDPNNPDAGVDCTTAIQNCINAFFNDTTTLNGVIVLRGMYRIGGALQVVTGSGGNRLAQLQLPRIAFSSTNMKIKTLSIISDITPVWEEQGIIKIPTQYGGAGFYSSLYSQPTAGKANFIFSAGIGTDATLFGGFNNINLFMDNITFLNRTHDANGAYVQNTMGALDVRFNCNFNFGNLLCKTTTPIVSSTAPDVDTYGILLPARNNHATVIGRYARVMGYNVGLWATEHLQLELYLGAANGVGLFCERSYQININTLTLEISPIPVQMGHASILNLGIYQSERVLDNSKWYANTSGFDFVQSTRDLEGAPAAFSQVNVGSYIVHNEGGAAVKGAWDPRVSMRIIQDEFKQSFFPIPDWGALPANLPTNPVNGLTGLIGNDLYVYKNGWRKVTLTAAP